MPSAVTVGSLVINMSADIATLKGNMSEGVRAVDTSTKAMVNSMAGVTESSDRATDAGARLVAQLKNEIATFGMTSQELTQHKANLNGVSSEVAALQARLQSMKSAEDSFKASVVDASVALKAHGAEAKVASGHAEGFSLATASAKREVLVLMHELSQGNYKKFGGSLMVLGEVSGAAGALFSAAGIAAIGMGAVLFGVAVAVAHGASEQKAMNDALIMSGNYAGQTSDSLNALAHAAVESGGSIGEAKKAVTDLAASGKFTGDQIGSVASAVIALEHATGASIDETIKQFESLSVQAQGHSARASTAISQATVKLDEQYHFLTLSVYEQITALEKEGDLKGASKVATEEFARITRERAEEIIGNLGNVARAWNTVKEGIGGAVDAVKDWGKKSTAASVLSGLNAQLASLDSTSSARDIAAGRPVGSGQDRTSILANEQRASIVAAIAVAQTDLNHANKIAADQAAETLTQSNAVRAAQRNDVILLRAQTREQGALTTAMKEYHANNDLIRAGNTSEEGDYRLTEKFIKDAEAAITKMHTQAVTGNDDRAKTLQDAILLEQTALDREKSVYDARDKMLGLYHSKFGMSDADFYSGREAARAEYIASEAIAFAKESALIQGYKPKNAEEVAASKTKYDELVKQHLKFVDDMRNAGGDDSIQILADAKKLYDDQAKAIATSGDSEIKSLDASIAKQREHNAEIGKTKEQIELAKKAQIEATTAALQIEDDAYRAALINKDLGGILIGNDRLLYEQRLAYLDRIIAKRKEDADLHAVGADLEGAAADDAAATAASKKLADMAIQDWQRAGTSIADSLTKAFGSGGKALGEMFKAYATNSANQLRLDKEMALAKTKLDTDPTKLKVIDDIQRQSAQAQLKSYGDMADAAEGFFDKGSKGYAAVHAASQVMHAAELAMNLASIAPAMAAGAAQFFAESGWGGFAGVAAMAAVVAGFGVAVSGSGGGGGQSAADVQKTQGTGSVFGDSTAKSDSIARSIALASANSSIELTHTAGMLAALNSIQASMSGLANLVVRATGVTDGTNMGIQTGTIAKSFGGVWGKTTQNVVDSGLQFGGSVRGLQSGQGFNQYASVDTTKSSWFGLSKSTSNSVQTQGIGNELSSQFGLVFTNLETSLKAAAVGLGGSAAQVSNTLDHLTLSTSKISLKGLTGDALTSAINGVMSKAMDDMAQAALPGYDRFRKVGEGYSETVTRVSTDFVNVGSIFDSMGKSLVTATTTTAGATTSAFSSLLKKVFGIVYSDMPASLTRVTTLSVDARERLIELAGGIDKMASQANSFTSNYLSEAERLAPVTKYVTDQMAALGYSSVNTRDQFKSLVLGLDVSTQKGAEQYTALMALSDAFAKTHAATVDLTLSTQAVADERKSLQDQLDQLTMSSTQLLTKQRNALDASNRGIFDQIQAAQKLKDAQDAAKTSLGDTITKMKSFADATKAYGSGLVTGSLSTLTPAQQYAETKRQFDKNVAAAKGGDAGAQGNYQSLATAFLTASQKINSSDSQYAADFAGVLQTTDEMSKWAAGQVDVAQASLDALNAQVAGIGDLNTTMLSVAQGIANLPSALSATPINPANYGGSDSMGLLVTEIKSLNAKIDKQNTIIEGLRTDANKNAGNGIVGNDQSLQATAETIVSGVGGLVGRVISTSRKAMLE